MRAKNIACPCLLVLAALSPCAAAQDAPRTSGAANPPRLLDVPFVSQTEALCGGAAAAMVLRYWGETTAYAEDFATLVDDSAEGITVNRLSRAIAERGWPATPFTGSTTDVEDHLARGRPIIALIEDRPGRYHYVVVVAWTGDRVVVHDPANGPFRIVSRTAFDRAWAVTGRTTMLVLPPTASAHTPPPSPLPPEENASRCSTPLDEAVRLARNGDLPNAEALLGLISVACSGPVRRELAGIRFLQERWGDAERLAGDAAARDPSDMQAWQLLAAARFLQGDSTGALHAWNRREEPRVDLARVDGLDRMRHDVVADVLRLSPGDLVTEDLLARARRRVGALPTIQLSRVGYTPRADGRATIDVAVLERPTILRKWPGLAAMGLHAAIEREMRFETANAVGEGELLSAAWRWWPGRPRVAVGLAAPGLWRAGGLWRVEGSWDRQLYRVAPANDPGASLISSARRRAALSFADWTTGDLRWQVSVALDRWADRGNHAAAGAAIEHRWLGDRLAVRAGATAWRAIRHREAGFARAEVAGAWRSTAEAAPTWTVRAGMYGASARAPLDVWPVIETGQIGPLLLRAHPLLEDGAIRAEDVSRVLAHTSVELQRPLAIRQPVRAWWVAFVDAARRGATRDGAPAPALVDVGVGLRLDVAGTPHVLRLDVGQGVRDGRIALSAGWQATWTGW